MRFISEKIIILAATFAAAISVVPSVLAVEIFKPYINTMDVTGADFDKTVISTRERLEKSSFEVVGEY